MITDKKSTIPCPDCKTPIPRQNYRKYLSRCGVCFKISCTSCSIEGLCHDCFMTVNHHIEISIYNEDKYSFRVMA